MLKYSADLRTLFFVALYFLEAIGSWFVHPPNGWATAGLVALNCVLSFFCAVIVHNTIHHPIFKSKTLNKIFQVVLTFTYGHPVSAYVAGHNLSHHRYTQTDKDSIRTTKARFRWNFLNQLLFFFLMSGDIISSEMRFVRRMYNEKPAWFRQYALEMVLVMGTKIALLVFDWQRALLYVLIPHQYAAWGVVGTNFWQHDGCDENHPYNHSRNFTGKFLNYLTFNNGFHGAHHDKPGLHWSLLPEYHEREIKPNLHPSLDQKSLFLYLWKALIWPGKRLDYLGAPVVLPPKTQDEDWVADLKIGQVKMDMGVEA